MAEERLRYKVTADTKQFVQGMKQVQSASVQANRNVRKQGQAFTQLAYALDDAQYGFRGVQNNIQALAVQMGASGPWVLAITAATVAIGYFIEKITASGREAKKAAKELDEYQKKVASIEKAQNSLLGQFSDPGVEQWRKRFEGLGNDYDKIGFLLGDLEQKQYEFTRAVKLDNDTLERRRKLGIKTSKEEGEQFNTRAKQLRELTALVKIVETKYDQLYKAANPPTKGPSGKKTLSLADQIELDLLDLELEDAAEGLDFGAFIDKLNTAADKAFGDTWRQSIKDIYKKATGDSIKEANDEIGNETIEGIGNLGAALQSSLSSAFYAVGESIGTALKDGFQPGDFLSIVADFMKSFGAALIAIGVAKLALESNLPGGVLIAAGIGLVAAGVLLAPGGAGHFSGKTQGNGSVGSHSPSVTPSVTQGGGVGGGLVATIRGQDLRFINQAAADSYNARN